jgi:hypothetical protein
LIVKEAIDTPTYKLQHFGLLMCRLNLLSLLMFSIVVQ